MRAGLVLLQNLTVIERHVLPIRERVCTMTCSWWDDDAVAVGLGVPQTGVAVVDPMLGDVNYHRRHC